MGKHYIPQEYMRGFATSDDPEQIWMFDKSKGTWHRAAISKVCQERDYFSTAIEELLRKHVETPGHLALKRLRNREQFTSLDRIALGNYIAVTMLRVPARRRRGHGLVPEVLKSVIQEAREVFTAIAKDDPEKLAGYLAQIAAAAQKYVVEPPQEVIEVIESPWPSQENLDAVHRMVWRFVLTPRPNLTYITSDNPAFFFDSDGVGTPKAELTFPISPTLCLLGSHQGEPYSTQFLRGNREMVMEANRRMVVGAERFVLSTSSADWVEKLKRHKDQRSLRRIPWHAVKAV